MAKYERELTGDFASLIACIDQGIMSRSLSAKLEDQSYFQSGGVRCAVRVYERYSAIGSNRVSLNVTLLCDGARLFLSAITSGGSQAVFFKINTFGEEAFLNQLADIVEKYIISGR